MIQGDLFGASPVVSRWPGDGPFPSTVWRQEENGTAIRRWFDGKGWCQALCAPCDRCGVWHPLDHRNDHPTHYVPTAYASAMRCPGGAGWWP